MKYLLMILLTACGADPDDYKVQEADGCPSSGCPEKIETPTDSGDKTDKTPEPVEPKFVCAEGKLCQGMFRETVLAMIGPPTTIGTGYLHGSIVTKWTYIEGPFEPSLCIVRYTSIDNDCIVYFYLRKDVGEEILVEVKDVEGKWLDPLGF